MLLDEQYAEAASGRITCNAGSVDASTDDGKIVGLHRSDQSGLVRVRVPAQGGARTADQGLLKSRLSPAAAAGAAGAGLGAAATGAGATTGAGLWAGATACAGAAAGAAGLAAARRAANGVEEVGAVAADASAAAGLCAGNASRRSRSATMLAPSTGVRP